MCQSSPGEGMPGGGSNGTAAHAICSPVAGQAGRRHKRQLRSAVQHATTGGFDISENYLTLARERLSALGVAA
jgi:hypothetical protein